jgi:hypothetical protein
MSKITTLLSEWVSSIAEASQPAREALRNRLNSLATAASPYILSFSSWMESPGWPVPYEISLSIFLVVDSIEQAKVVLWTFLSDLVRIPTSISEEMKRQMREGGWCKSDMTYFSSFLPLLGTFYLSHMKGARKYLKHGSCTDRECVAMNVIKGQYQTQHQTQDCQCDELEINCDSLCDITMDDHKIPVVAIAPVGLSGEDTTIDFDRPGFVGSQYPICSNFTCLV